MNIDIDYIYNEIVKYYIIDDYDSIIKYGDLSYFELPLNIKIDIILFIYIKVKWVYYRLYDIYKLIKLLKTRNRILYRFGLNIIFEHTHDTKLGSEIIIYKRNEIKHNFIDVLIYIHYLKRYIDDNKYSLEYKIHLQKAILYVKDKIVELRHVNNLLECKYYDNFIKEIEKKLYNNSFDLVNNSTFGLFNYFIYNFENNKYIPCYKYYDDLLDKPNEINSNYLYYYKFIYDIKNGFVGVPNYKNRKPDFDMLVDNILSHNDKSNRFNSIIEIHKCKLLISMILYCKVNYVFNYSNYLLIIKNIRNNIKTNKYNNNYILLLDYYIALLSKDYDNLIFYGEQIINKHTDILLNRDYLIYIELLYTYYYLGYYDKYI